MLNTRRHAIILLFLALFVSLAYTFCQASEPFTFVMIGDARIGQTESVYTAFIHQMEKEKITTIINLGDAISTPGSPTEWERLLEITGKGKTLHVALGNHDVYDKASLDLYTKLFEKPPYYSVERGDTLLIFLSTEMPQQWARITGGGGARLLTYREDHGGFHHYVIAKRQNGGYLFTAYDMKGNVRDEFPVKK